MEKEALIDIILNDIKEVHALVNTFKGKPELNAAFINLTRTKIANINEELSLLEQLNVKKVSTDTSESSLTSPVPAASVQEDNMAIAESSGRFVAGESNMEAKPESGHEKPSVNDTMNVEAHTTRPDSETIATANVTKHSDTETMAVTDNTKHSRSETTVADSQAIDSEGDTMEAVSKAKITNVSTTGLNDNFPKKASTKKEATSAAKKSVLGEVINKDTSSVNDKLSNKKEVVEDIKQIGKPVDDVKKAFGLNDRFYYQRELFNNNADLFNQTLDQINSMASYDSAISFLQSNYNWGVDNEASEAFFRSIKRRFI